MTLTELKYLDGLTKAIQDELWTKFPPEVERVRRILAKYK